MAPKVIVSYDDTANDRDALAGRLAATVVAGATSSLDMLVVGSRSEAGDGRLLLSALSDYAIETASCPVLALPRGRAVRFARTLVTA